MAGIRSAKALKYLRPPELHPLQHDGPLIVGVTGGACGGKVMKDEDLSSLIPLCLLPLSSPLPSLSSLPLSLSTSLSLSPLSPHPPSLPFLPLERAVRQSDGEAGAERL